MSDIYDILHDNLVYLTNEAAFDEYVNVYKKLGGHYIYDSLFEIRNLYYSDIFGNRDYTKNLFACNFGYGWMIDNNLYQKYLYNNLILIDHRIEKDEYYKLMGI